VLVFRAIVDQQEDAGRRQALQQAVEQGLRLGVDPVQVFEDQQHRLLLTLTQEHALERLEGALAPLRGIELQERAVLRQRVEERQQRRDRLLESRVERQHLTSHLRADRVRVVALIHVAVALEQVDHREVRRRLAV
jgi:hypothetical protein